ESGESMSHPHLRLVKAADPPCPADAQRSDDAAALATIEPFIKTKALATQRRYGPCLKRWLGSLVGVFQLLRARKNPGNQRGTPSTHACVFLRNPVARNTRRTPPIPKLPAN